MKSPNGSIGRATLLIVVSAICFGSISVLTILVTSAGVLLLPAMAWRYVIGAALLAPTVTSAAAHTVPRRRVIQLLLVGGCGQALITYLSLLSLNYIPVGPLAFLFYTYPAWVALIAAARKTERLTPVRITALVLALIGVTVMIGTPAERLSPVGVTLAIASAILYSVYLPALEHLQDGVPPMFATFLLVAGAAISFVTSALLTGQLSIPREFPAWIYILVLATVSSVLAFSTLIRGLAVLGPVRTAIIATVEPFFTAVLGMVVLGNRFSVATLVGGALIATAILVIEWSSTRARATA